jgi:uncharacterized protein YktA (UPF0223 family)
MDFDFKDIILSKSWYKELKIKFNKEKSYKTYTFNVYREKSLNE